MNPIKLSFILPLLLISQNSLQAESLKVKVPKSLCSDLDIRDTMKSDELKEHFTRPRSQGSSGWCYGFVAADLLSVEAEVPLSSTHVSSIYNSAIFKEALENEKGKFYIYKTYKRTSRKGSDPEFKKILSGGNIYWAVKDSVDKRYLCSEKDLPFDASGLETTKSELINNLENIKKLEWPSLPSKLGCERAKSIVEFLGVNASVYEVWKLILNNNVNISLEKLTSMSCKDPVKLDSSIEVKRLKIPKADSKKYARSSFGKRKLERDTKKIIKAFKKIGYLLSHGRPVAVNYNANHISIVEGDHSSSITGRRWKNGRCEYKVRNSWGESCIEYNDSDITGCNREEGSFWVTDQKLYEMAQDIFYIDS
ncbi:MAG: hypothetical protein CME64_09980 [Halobacteriovoraceae bacterium]|nr:hypothetical protein [Halobacteriovoraceae bacterium]|tara:strand:+ start:85820 stop:86917 length:1098 start_codon:yes stop_codon:yes gene_type:complete